MSDPRNTAHDKKVKHQTEHRPQAPADAAAPAETEAGATPAAEVAVNQADLEKSVGVLSKLKEMEFHSRANMETLAGLTLTIDDELKQKEFSAPLGELYSAQDAFQSRVAAFVASYGTKCESLKAAV